MNHRCLLVIVVLLFLFASCVEEDGVCPYRPNLPTAYNRHETSDVQFLLDSVNTFVPTQHVAMVALEKECYLYKDNTRMAFSFDTAGRCLDIFSKEDGMYEHLHYEYDSIGRRVSEVCYSDTVPLSDESRLTPIRTTYAYKRGGRLCKAVIQGENGKKYRFRLRYGKERADGSRLLTDYTYPDGSRCSYQYDTAGRLARETFPNGSYVRFTYDSEGHLSSSSTPSENNILHFENTVWYAPAVVQQRDEQGRIQQRQNGQVVERYVYDEYGNWIMCNTTRNGELFSRTTRQITYY